MNISRLNKSALFLHDVILFHQEDDVVLLCGSRCNKKFPESLIVSFLLTWVQARSGLKPTTNMLIRDARTAHH